MAITLTQAQEHLAQWLEADRAVSLGQSYSVGGQSVTRADASRIREQITYWSRAVKELEAVAAGVTNPGFITPSFS